MSSSNRVMTLDLVVAKIRGHRASGMTYSKIGALYGIGKGTVWNIEHGAEPISPRIRAALGLSPELHPAMYHEVLVCSMTDCVMPFIPNSPLRTKCFGCSPYKGSKQ